MRLLPMLAFLIALLPVQAPAQTLSEDDVKRLALEAILENPEIIMQAVEILRARDAEEQARAAAEALDGQRKALEADPNAPVLGNPDGDVTIVEFFDYNCPYCKRAAEQVNAVLAADGNVRLVMREWPILSEDSIVAARVALASREQGRYEDVHDTLMGMPRATEAGIMRAVEDLGLDMERLRADMALPSVNAHIALSRQLADALGFTGTPSFVIGSNLVPGFVQADQLAALVEEARKAAD